MKFIAQQNIEEITRRRSRAEAYTEFMTGQSLSASVGIIYKIYLFCRCGTKTRASYVAGDGEKASSIHHEARRVPPTGFAARRNLSRRHCYRSRAMIAKRSEIERHTMTSYRRPDLAPIACNGQNTPRRNTSLFLGAIIWRSRILPSQRASMSSCLLGVEDARRRQLRRSRWMMLATTRNGFGAKRYGKYGAGLLAM